MASAAWDERSMYKGRFELITDLARNGTHTLEVWGNVADGWQIYLVSNGSGIAVSPHFHRDYGDTRRALIEACQRAYDAKPTIGRNWL